MRRQSEKAKASEVATDREDDQFEETYFTYRPLSNLPTPPPSTRNSSAIQSPQLTLDDGEPLDLKFRGPAIHLVNLIPASASLASASITLVQAILTRASLPMETIALAVCILDSLDSKFGRTWRFACPLSPGCTSPTSRSKRHTLPPQFTIAPQQQQQNIDFVSPELIVLAALVIAVKFLDDPSDSTRSYCDVWGKGMWSCGQLNVTEKCIVENVNYRIMPLFDEECIEDAIVDMQLAGQLGNPSWPVNNVSTPPEDASMRQRLFVPSHTRAKTTCSSSQNVLNLSMDTKPMEELEI